MHELKGIVQREVRELASRVLGEPEGPTLDRTAEADLRVGLRCHERMFPCVRGLSPPHLFEAVPGACARVLSALSVPPTEGAAMQVTQRVDRRAGQSLRVLELSRAIGSKHVDLPLAWAQSHDDVVVAFELFSETNWQAHLVNTSGDVLLAFPWHDHADRILLRPYSAEFPVHADGEAWTAQAEGWWAWVKADGQHVYIAESDGDEIDRIRRVHKLEQRSPGLVAVGGVEFSWNRVPRVAYDRAWQDAIDTCNAGSPSPVGEWVSEDPSDRRLRLSF